MSHQCKCDEKDKLVLPFPDALDELFTAKIKLCYVLLALELLLNDRLSTLRLSYVDAAALSYLRRDSGMITAWVVQRAFAAHAIP